MRVSEAHFMTQIGALKAIARMTPASSSFPDLELVLSTAVSVAIQD